MKSSPIFSTLILKVYKVDRLTYTRNSTKFSCINQYKVSKVKRRILY